MALFLGIDGGGTKTACVVGDHTHVLGTGIGGASNVVRVGEHHAGQSLSTAIQAACSTAHVSPTEIAVTCVGIAGVSAARDTVRRLVSGLVAGRIEVVGDMEIALDAAFPEGVGLVVIAGTGSIAYGRNEQGTTARAGGWGHAISDEGSGYWIGRAAVAALLRALDAGKPTLLAETVSELWETEQPEDLVRRVNASAQPDFATLMPAVVRAAEGGDPQATTVLSQAGAELAKLAEITIRALWPADRQVNVGVAGGVFEHSAVVTHAFIEHLHAARAQVTVHPAVVQPVDGALALARRLGSELRAAQRG